MTHDSKVMSDVILKISNLDIQVPGRTLIKQLNWQVGRGERWCLIGRNGAGKSTLMNIVYGLLKADSGEILVDGKKVNIPSFRVKAGQKVEIIEKSKNNPQIKRAVELTNQAGMVDWVNVDKDKLFGIFARVPERAEVVIPVEERLIVELYSK